MATQSLPTTPTPKLSWLSPTPAWLVYASLLATAILFLSERWRWFPFNEHKGWTVLIAVAGLAVVLLLMLAWFVAALIFRRRFQFGIRTLLLLVVAVALPFSWLGVEMKKAREQREAVEVIYRIPGIDEREARVAYDYERDTAWLYKISRNPPPGPKWLRRVFGDDFFRRTEFVFLLYCKATDADLSTVKKFPDLRVLFIGGPGISDAGLEHLSGLSRLEVIGGGYSKITDSGVDRLKELHLPALCVVGLDQTQITDTAIESMELLPRLQALSLRETKIGDRGLEHLTRLTQLENLDLSYTPVSLSGMKQLAKLPKLKYLALNAAKVTDSGLECLTDLPNLEVLWISQNSKVTDDGVAKLQQTLPNCKITR